MINIISALLPTLLKLLGMYFESKNASEDQRQAYKEFVMKMQMSQNTPAKIKDSYDEQLKRLQQQNPAE